ncbi:MAG: hypothetical protein K0R38_1828 [Polyangiaceae bacterium]|nr:hypothetical protein [Polyangiaceae bacterium]
MNRSALALFALPLVFSCGVEDLSQPPGNTAGTGGTGAVAGTPTTSGGSAMGGSGGAGGSGTPTAGSSMTGGSGGSGGVATAGTGTGGGGTGGAPMGGSGGAAGGSGGSAGGATGPTIADVVGKLDGFLFIAPCGDGGTGFDCLNSTAVPAPQNSPTCQNQQTKNTTVDFAIGGEAGKVYDVTVHVYGVVESKNYQGGMRRDGNNMNASATGGDFWYTGGTAPNSTYNTYELHVTPKVEGAPNDYYLNSRNGTNEGHESWALNYTATFPVTGGGKVNFRVFDSNCRQIMNCGPGTGSSNCAAPRQLDLSATDPKPPGSFTQPFVGGAPNGATGQWVFFDVTSVVAK